MILKVYTFSLGAHKKNCGGWEGEHEYETGKNPTALWLFPRCMKQTSHNRLSTERTFTPVTMAMNQAGQSFNAVMVKATS